MRERPLVSIVVNNYNYERFVGEAIDSALNQTYPNTETIVVDDGSTDGSREVISGYGDRVVTVLKGNGGQASACNAGFAVSGGEIVIFLDADDVLLPDTVQRVVAAFLTHPNTAKVQCRLQEIDARGEPLGRLIPASSRHRIIGGDLLRHVLKFHSYPRAPMSGNAFAAAALRRFLPIPEELYQNSADLYLNDLSIMFGPTVFLEEAGALYRVHGKNQFKSISSAEVLASRGLPKTAHNRAEQKRLFEELYSIRVREVGPWDLFYLRNRTVSLRLDPVNHPFEDGLVSLCARGCVSAAIYPGLGWRRRIFYGAWFSAMVAAPKPLAGYLAQQSFDPRGGSLREKLSAGVRRLGRTTLYRAGTVATSRAEGSEGRQET